jgi:hypothetical protein
MEVLRLEFTYLVLIMEATLRQLPSEVDLDWRCKELDEWLRITYFIKYMQVEQDDYNNFFLAGGTFGDTNPASFGKHTILYLI